MTRLSSVGARSPVHAHLPSEEDRSTYRRWARLSTIAYFIITGLLAVGISLRDERGSQRASRDQTIVAGTKTPAPQVTGGISKHN